MYNARCIYRAGGHWLTLTTLAGTATYTRNDANQLQTITDPQSGTANYYYDPTGLRTQLVLPNDVTVDYGCDTLNRLTSINQHKGATVPAFYAHIHDPVGNRMQVVEADGSSIQ